MNFDAVSARGSHAPDLDAEAIAELSQRSAMVRASAQTIFAWSRVVAAL
jgi:hypothetical protein